MAPTIVHLLGPDTLFNLYFTITTINKCNSNEKEFHWLAMNNLSFNNLTDLIFYSINLLTSSCYSSWICDLVIVKQDNLSKYTAYKMNNWHVQYWLKLTFKMVMGCVNAAHSCKISICTGKHLHTCNSISNKAAHWTKLDGTIWYRGKLHHEWMEWLVMIMNSVTW